MPADATYAFALEPISGDALPRAFNVRESFSSRAWHFQTFDAETARALELSGLSAPLARLLSSRGLKLGDAQNYLEPRLKLLLSDPHALAGMEAAATRFADAILNSETIAILGDYDVDGACSSALLLRFLRACNREPLLYIPDRMTEGYGPSAGAMRNLKARGANLVVTVDCGAAAHTALAAAREEHLDVVVLDHHAVETNPPAFAHVNPNGPDDRSGLTYVCAAGIVFLFLIAVQRLLRQRGWYAAHGIAEIDLLQHLDIVALATVADVVPLTGVNRAFVRQGLKIMERLERSGFGALAKVAGCSPPFSTYTLGFVMGPRVNAGGRVGQCDLGARLLSSDDAAEAETLATILDRHNRERQSVEASILESAEAKALTQSDKPFLFCTGDGWHPGVVGIVASRLKERFGKPTLVAGFGDCTADSIARGSGRSVPGVDLGAAIRAAYAEGLLESGGGHAMAVGFSVRRGNLAALTAFLETRMAPQQSLIEAARDLALDVMISPSGATLSLINDLERAGPFGSGNPEPIFALADVAVAYAGIVGTSHVKLRLVGRDGATLDAIAFRAGDTPLGRALVKSRGSRIHVAGKLRRDDYGGTPRVQLQIEDAAPAQA